MEMAGMLRALGVLRGRPGGIALLDMGAPLVTHAHRARAPLTVIRRKIIPLDKGIVRRRAGICFGGSRLFSSYSSNRLRFGED